MQELSIQQPSTLSSLASSKVQVPYGATEMGI